MAQKLYPPRQVKLMVGMLSTDSSLFDLAEAEMVKLWGPTDCISEIIPFTFTRYYNKAMGEGLLRKFVSFSNLIMPPDIARIKHQSNALELAIDQSPSGLALGVKRAINLDPGYLNSSKLVLVTTKDYSHRIYIGDNMYAETTLHYCDDQWHSWPFTYPDFASGAYFDFLNAARDKFIEARVEVNLHK